MGSKKSRSDCGVFGSANGVRGVLALVCAAGLAPAAAAQVGHWSAGNGTWTNPFNWAPFGVPEDDAAIFLGTLASNATVALEGFGPRHMVSLDISNGMTLRNNLGSFVVAGDTHVSGSNTVVGPGGLVTEYASRLLMEPMKGASLTTHDLSLTDGARIVFTGTAFVGVEGTLSVDSSSRITGDGFFNLNGSGTTVMNNGRLRGADGEGLTLRQNNGGLFDLDGTSGNGIIDASTGYESRVRITGTALTDSFSGDIVMSRSSRLDMELSEGWTADAGSTITVLNDYFGDWPATIRGGAMTFRGEMDLSSGLSIYSSAAVFEPEARVHIRDGFFLSMGGSAEVTDTTINGGIYTMEPGTTVAIYDHATMRGGEFQMEPNEFGYKGRLRLLSGSTWDGDLIINGVTEVYEHATVAGPTVISADTFDMSPLPFTPTVWDIGSTLVLNASAIRQVEGDRFIGTMNIDAGALSRLTLNLFDPTAAWTMGGGLNLAGVGALPATRVAGSRMIVDGALNVTSGTAQVTADTVFAAAQVDITDGATLRMRGRTSVSDGAEFTGAGTLWNGIDGMLTLDHGAALGGTGLVNDSWLTVGDGTLGVASVDRFESTIDGIWAVEVGSTLAVASSDLLLIGNGGALLDGQLDVMLADLGGGGFTPHIGDQFTILIASGSVSGAFTNDPVSVAGSLSYEWSIIYTPNSVVLRLDHIVPAPGSVALVGLGGLIACRRRR